MRRFPAIAIALVVPITLVAALQPALPDELKRVGIAAEEIVDQVRWEISQAQLEHWAHAGFGESSARPSWAQ